MPGTTIFAVIEAQRNEYSAEKLRRRYLEMCRILCRAQVQSKDVDISLGRSTVSAIMWRVINAAENIVCPQYIMLHMTPEERQNSKAHFYEKFQIPGVVGCIDGTHIKLNKPSEDESLYLNRKGTFSVNAMIIFLHMLAVEITNVDASDQYHIQTDEGPERYFRFQTNNGQFRKEKRLQDGTVIGTEAWIDAAGYMRLKDYIADKQGYRILKSKVVFVGLGAEIEDAMKATKSVPAQSGVLVDGRNGFNGRPNSLSSETNGNSKQGYIYATTTTTTTTTTPNTPTERPILGYLSPAEAAKLEPTPYLGFDHYPNELPVAPKRKQPIVYEPAQNPLGNYHGQAPYQFGTTISSTQRPYSAIAPPSIEMQPPVQTSRRRIRPIAIAPSNPTPLNGNELQQSIAYGGYSTPKPFAESATTSSKSAGYFYGQTSSPNAYDFSYHNQPSQALPYDVNALEGLLPPLPPLYQRRRVVGNQAAYTNQLIPDYNEVTVNRDGFRYVLPHQYHEEAQVTDSKKAGSYGYVDPFGIRRVVYYNASPEKGFVHRNRNRYVGLGAAPFDEPQPAEAA